MEFNIVQKACRKLTSHKFRKYVGYVDYRDVGDPIEYYYKCKICGSKFWNYKPPTKKQNKNDCELPIVDNSDCHAFKRKDVENG